MKTINKYILEIKNTLHLDVTLLEDNPISKQSIPIAIKTNYDIFMIKIADKNCVILVCKYDIRAIKKHLSLLDDAFELPIILAIENINLSMQKFLIENHISFVSTSAIYLPQLLIYINHLPARYNHKKSQKLSKLAQMTLIYLIQNKKFKNRQLDIKTISSLWSVTDMSSSRTLSELVNFGYLVSETFGRKKIFRLKEKIDFEKLMDNFKNPVVDTVYINADDLPYFTLKAIASYSALSRYTNITSHQDIFAVEKKYFNKVLKIKHNITLYESDYDDGLIQMQLWRYPPMLNDFEDHIVDMMSLYASLKDTIDAEDTRALNALDELAKKIKEVF